MTETQNATPDTAATDDAPARWTVTYHHGSTPVSVTVTAQGIRDEIRDQASVKGSQRKGVLRTTRKRLTALLKKPQASLTDEDQEELEWNAFILLIDSVIANRHLKLRDTPDLVEEVAADPRLTPPGAESA